MESSFQFSWTLLALLKTVCETREAVAQTFYKKLEPSGTISGTVIGDFQAASFEDCLLR